MRISGSQTIAKTVLDGEHELGLTGAIWNERGLECPPLFTDTPVVVTRPGGVLVAKQSVPIGEMVAPPCG